MKTLDDIRQQLSAGEFEFGRHAFNRAVERNISDIEIRQAGLHARIIGGMITPDGGRHVSLSGVWKNGEPPGTGERGF